MKHLFASAFLLLAACGGSAPAASTDTTATQAGAQIANPASGYCREIGGELEMREGDGGTAGICKKDGAECEEWALYRGECPEMGPGNPDAAAGGDEAGGDESADGSADGSAAE